jgi:hypothetical protein
MIGSIQQLFDASIGKSKKRQVTLPGVANQNTPPLLDFSRLIDQFTPKPQVQLVENFAPQTYREQFANRLASSRNPISGGATTFNDTYVNLLNSGRPTGGLSSKGKYSGFYTADERNNAVEGGTLQLAGQVPGTLREKAQARFDQIDQAKTQAYDAYVQQLMDQYGGERMNPNFMVYASSGPEGGYIDRVVNPAREYERQLQAWGEENAAGAYEYLDAAQQFENTNLSQLAQSVATRQYGINPSLATSLFGDFEQRRNEELWNDAESDRQAGLAQANTQLETITGYRGNTVAGLTGRSPAQLYRGMNTKIALEEGGRKQYGYNIAENASALISTGENQQAFDLAESLESAPGGAETAAVIYAMLYLGGYNKENLKNKLVLSGIVAP